MNKDRRKQIAEVTARIPELESLRDELKDALESIRDDEQEYFDNMPESFQYADKGTSAQEAIDALDAAIDALDGLDTDDITTALETAGN